MYGTGDVKHRLAPLFAVLTIPLGVLAYVFFGLQAAAAAFVVGWLLLVPACALLWPPWIMWADMATEEMESAMELQEMAQELDTGGGGEATGGPVEELRDRYARGEIDEAEFERRLEALLETEDVSLDPADERAIERTLSDETTGRELEQETE